MAEFSLATKRLLQQIQLGLYEFEGKIYNYYPDFILNDGSYVEIKGYDSKRWQAKVNAFPTNLKLSIIYKEDI